MTLRERQSHFVRLVADLIRFAYRHNYALTFGECYRSPEEAARLAKLGKGIVDSLHTKRLAIDLHLFIEGKYQPGTEAYRPLGVYWESLSDDECECCWGGRFTRKDGGHFSIAYGGRK